jgi:hypothetical protein
VDTETPSGGDPTETETPEGGDATPTGTPEDPTATPPSTPFPTIPPTFPPDPTATPEPATPEVVEVWFEEFDEANPPLFDNDSLSGVLGGIGGGLGIFPDKLYPSSDGLDEKKVLVCARVDPPYGLVRVHFRSFDVDDPSDDSLIDNPNLTEDNRGTPHSGNLEASSKLTDNDGIARVAFTVTLQPGDNFRVVAHIFQDYLDEITVVQPDDEGRLHDGSGANVPDSYQTEMLTVWRRLHVELDSMGEIPTTGPHMNHIEGVLASVTYDSVTNESTLGLGQNLPEGWEDQDQFEEGHIIIETIGTFNNVTGNTSNLIFDDELTITGNIPPAAIGQHYSLYDDDAFTMPEIPDFGLMQEIYHKVYIDPFRIPFVTDLNVRTRQEIT